MLRVAKDYVIITAPFYSKKVINAEKECNNFYKKIYKKDFHWFAKTLKNGFPELGEVKNLIKDYDYKIYPNAYIKRWKKIIKINIILNKYLFPFALLFNAFCNLLLYNFDNKEPSYRKIIFIKLNTNK